MPNNPRHTRSSAKLFTAPLHIAAAPQLGYSMMLETQVFCSPEGKGETEAILTRCIEQRYMSEPEEFSIIRWSIQKWYSKCRMCREPRTIDSHLALNHLRSQQSLHCRYCLVTEEYMISKEAMTGWNTLMAHLGLNKIKHRVYRRLVAPFYRTTEVLVWPFAEAHVANDSANLLPNHGLSFFWNEGLKTSLFSASTFNMMTVWKLFYVFEIWHSVRSSSVKSNTRKSMR